MPDLYDETSAIFNINKKCRVMGIPPAPPIRLSRLISPSIMAFNSAPDVNRHEIGLFSLAGHRIAVTSPDPSSPYVWITNSRFATTTVPPLPHLLRLPLRIAETIQI